MRQAAIWVAVCFAAASAVPFLPPEDAARFSAAAFGAPPLLILAAATVAGAAALVTLERGGFFGAVRTGGLRAAIVLGALLAVPAVALDLARPWPVGSELSAPRSWLFDPATVPVAAAALILVPLAAAFGLTRRVWPAILLAALPEPALRVALAGDAPGWQIAAMSAQLGVFGFAGLLLLGRHGILALVALRLIYSLAWHLLWDGVRLPLPFGGP